MKKGILMIGVVLAIITVLIVSGNAVLNSIGTVFKVEPDIIQEVISPDGKYVAYVFESNVGATANFTYRLSVLKNGKKLKAGDLGNALITYHLFDVEWTDNKTLNVKRGITSMDDFKHETKVDDIRITYDNE